MNGTNVWPLLILTNLLTLSYCVIGYKRFKQFRSSRILYVVLGACCLFLIVASAFSWIVQVNA